MRTHTGTFVMACVLSTVLLLSGCGTDSDGDGDDADAGGELLLQPAAAQGPDPFTDSTATTTATPSPAPRTPGRAGPDGPSRISAGLGGLRSLSGGTPGLYGGIERTGSCDIARQIGHLTRDRARIRAFARVAGTSPAAVPDYVRRLTPLVLRADTRVTNHGFRAGRAGGYQSVLQAGTAVLVDDRGLPRVRCACGNPLRPPVAMRGMPRGQGTPWPGYRPGEVIVVTPAPQVITDFTIIDVAARTWIERPTGHDVRHDRALPPPLWAQQPPASRAPSPSSPGESDVTPREPRVAPPESGLSPGVGSTAPRDAGSPADAVPPPIDASVPPPDETDPLPDEPAPADPGRSEEVGPDTVPDSPDLPDGAGLIPDGD
ncbi:DUF6777 domain-containing protein [Streptomyces purpurascens]|uniref:DUF6777 domain-containing protein n=1 Tax=Streptomyces purpurascens TaxID=1924 RepID=UPI0016793385|nr:DUF6777 domain-containing protein [Streptomyces purpurascens]MCE7046943.1 hypothetical protein [Streptomyces purpurascens]GHA04349.1 hypothetical protein GCM10010303_12640 [Streptomyces purpurascens]